MDYKKYLTQKNLAIAYIVFLVFSVLYIRNVMAQDSIDVGKAKEKKVVADVKPVKVTLIVENGNNKKTYEARSEAKLTNMDTMLNLLEALRTQQGLTYEKTAYTYGIELNMINGIKSDDKNVWNAYLGDKKISSELETLYLKSGETYTLRLEPRN